jgi:hypothetical protein
LTGAELGSQLAALGQKHKHVADPHLAQQLSRIVPQLYMALDNLPSTELSAAAAVLEGQPSVWVGNGFVDASRVAFKVSCPRPEVGCCRNDHDKMYAHAVQCT